MGKFKNKIYRFMYGRYGSDDLYYFIFIAFLVLWLCEIVLGFALPEGVGAAVVSIVLSTLSVTLLVWAVFRVFSRNVVKRRRENERYLKAKRAVGRLFSGNTARRSKGRNMDDFQYIFRDCTACGATLRLPRKSGKHSVKCPRCSHKFYVRAK